MFWSQIIFLAERGVGCAMWLAGLAPNQGIKFGSPVVEMQIPNHWTARQVPKLFQ